jgi:hypothetical protein
MLSKSTARATIATLTLLFAASCSRLAPWRDDPLRPEVNLAFTFEQNLVVLSTVQINGRPGRILFGSALPRTVIDSQFVAPPRFRNLVQLSERESLRIDPIRQDLHGVADVLLGTEAFRRAAITIDYHAGLVTYQKEGIKRGYMTVFRFPAEPMLYATIDGRETAVIVDTTSPDTLVLPGADRRGTANVVIAGTDFGAIDVRYAAVSHPRIGNRLLSKFLVTIDYRQQVVGLWRDPRTRMTQP